MKTQIDAQRKALELSRRNKRDYFVVYSPNEYDIPGNDYHVSSEIDLDGFYNGCQVLFATEDYYANT